VELPEGVGKGGDVTDFFVRLGKSSDDFRKLLAEAMPAPPPPQTANGTAHDQRGTSDPALRERIDRIKAELSIAKLIGRYVKLQKSGNNLVGLCPFHEDHNPSLTVFPETGTFHCFGCRKHGDAITFVREIEQLSFHQTLDALDHLSAQQHEPQ
jgi:hypothetical protein